MHQVLMFALEKETKGALRYKELVKDGQPVTNDFTVGTLYVRKQALIDAAYSSDRFPKKLKVELHFEE